MKTKADNQLATLAIDGPTATLTLNRPEQRNALSIEQLDVLHTCMDKLEVTDGIVATVITGSGRAFCAGMDLRQVVIDKAAGGSGDTELPYRLLWSLGRLTLRIRSLPHVTIASVNGAAVGGGCGLACVCDYAVTHADAKLGFPEVDLGLCPAVVTPWLVRKIGPGPARAVLLMGGVMTGEDAHRRGIVDECAASREELETLTAAIVERFEKGGPAALAATKGLLNRIDGSLDEDLIRRGAELSASVLRTPEAQAKLIERLR